MTFLLKFELLKAPSPPWRGSVIKNEIFRLGQKWLGLVSDKKFKNQL
jgi:hypothetical protein